MPLLPGSSQLPPLLGSKWALLPLKTFRLHPSWGTIRSYMIIAIEFAFRNQVSLLCMVFYELTQPRDILTCSPPIPNTEPCPQCTLSKYLLNEYSYAKSIMGNRRLELIRPNRVQRRGASSIDISSNSKSKSPSWNSESDRGCWHWTMEEEDVELIRC